MGSANIIKFPKSAAKSRSRRKGNVGKGSMTSSVVAFPRRKPRYSLDIISERPVDGMVLIEACLPVAALEVLMDYLRGPPTPPDDGETIPLSHCANT